MEPFKSLSECSWPGFRHALSDRRPIDIPATLRVHRDKSSFAITVPLLVCRLASLAPQLATARSASIHFGELTLYALHKKRFVVRILLFSG